MKTEKPARDIPFSTRLTAARTAAGLTQAAVANKAGITQSAYCKIEKGYRFKRDRQLIEKIAAAVGTTAVWLEYEIDSNTVSDSEKKGLERAAA